MNLNVTIVNTALFFQQLALLSNHEDMVPCSVSQTGPVAAIVFSAKAAESTDFIIATLSHASQGQVCSGVQIV